MLAAHVCIKYRASSRPEGSNLQSFTTDQCQRGYHHIKRALLSDRSNHRADGDGVKGHGWVVVMARAWQCYFGGRSKAESVEWRAMDKN